MHNYVTCGSSSCPFAQTTQITGDVTIGSSSAISTRVRIKDIKFIGNITFVSSTFNELRTHISNCDFSGLLTLPTTCATIAGGGTQIFFNYFF